MWHQILVHGRINRLVWGSGTLRSTLPQGGQPRPWPRPLRNHRAEKAATVEDQEKTTLMPPTMHRPMEKSQRALIWSESTPLMNLLIA